jgi:hypothetical protein
MFRRTATKHRRFRPAPKPPVLLCPSCGSDKACPIDWAEAGAHHWWLLIRCGECEAWIQATVGNELAAELDMELDRQQRQIAEAADALQAELMAADADLLATALELDLVDADDFAR